MEETFLIKLLLILIKDEAKIIRRLFYLYLSGLSISEVTLQAKDLSFPNKGQNAIGRLLGYCIYAGRETTAYSVDKIILTQNLCSLI